jgi:hypothetical protein
MEDLDRILRFPIPKYTESAPAWIAACNDSNEPAGEVISNSINFLQSYSYLGIVERRQ